MEFRSNKKSSGSIGGGCFLFIFALAGWGICALIALNAVWGIVHHVGGGSHASNPGPGDVWDERGPIARPD